MVNGFIQSPEGEAEFGDLGLVLPEKYLTDYMKSTLEIPD